MPTVFEDFLNNDWMPRANSTAPAVNVNGILTVTMPKTEPKQKVTKAIEVS